MLKQCACVRRCSLSPDRHEIKIEEVVCAKGGHPVRGEAVEDWKERPRLHGGAASLTGDLKCKGWRGVLCTYFNDSRKVFVLGLQWMLVFVHGVD